VARAVVDSKRRLPVLKSTPASDDPVRPGWQWIIFGALLTLVAWVLLSTLVIFLDGALMATFDLGQNTPGSLAVVFITVPHVLALALSASFSGHLIGRYGGATAGLREAVGGALVAALIGVFATFTGTWTEKLIRTAVVLFVSTLSAGLSARRAIRRR
jgi:hypothetical protein